MPPGGRDGEVMRRTSRYHDAGCRDITVQGEAPAGADPPVTLRLLSKGQDTIGHETNLARAPLWGPARSVATQLDLLAPTVLYGRQFSQIDGRALTVGDQRLLAELSTRWVRDGCRADRQVPISLNEAAVVLGHTSTGGKQRQLVRESLQRLKSVSVRSAVRHADGHEEELVWGLVSWYRTTTRDGGQGMVVLSEPIACLLCEGSVTFLHAPTWDAISGRDEIAGRLWSFLEAEQLDSFRRYHLFAGPPGGPDMERNLPAIADLLRLQWERKKVAARVREACAVIRDIDARYGVIQVVKATTPGMWRLEVRRAAMTRPRLTTSRPVLDLPPIVVAAWREGHGRRVPSAAQAASIREVLTRQSAEQVAAVLRQQSDDPFRALLDFDRGASDERLREASTHEQEWEREKAAEQAGAASIASLLDAFRR